uniref:Uncharacterized protein n=1 Tax=Strigamia maritima TaxID=126957 RepID=T1JMN4_STRMM
MSGRFEFSGDWITGNRLLFLFHLDDTPQKRRLKTYLENIISNFIDLNYGWITITLLVGQHSFKTRRTVYQYYLMCVEDAAFYSELYVG